MTKELTKLPPRILRFRLRLMRYSPRVVYVPGKDQVPADALSRATASKPEKEDDIRTENVEVFAVAMSEVLPATPARLQEIKGALMCDEECRQILEYCLSGWPPYVPGTPFMNKYFDHQAHFSIVNDFIVYDARIVVPRELR